MPYKFTFDLSKTPQFFFTEIARLSYEKKMHRKISRALQDIIRKFRIQEATGLNLTDAVKLVEDLIDMEFRNLLDRERFKRTRKRALFLPHCARKYMDGRCKAEFNSEIPSYKCGGCSPDCLVNVANVMAKQHGYDVYILPGGSCILKILKSKNYEGIVGVACGEELKLAGEILTRIGLPGQAVPLLKNGCANTVFSIETLQKILEEV